MKFITLILWILISLPLSAAPQTLTYSGPPNAAPFSYHQPPLITGLCAELINRFSKLNLLKPEPFLVPWKRSLVMASQGQLDLICGLYKTPKRQQVLDYSVPFASEKVSLFLPLNSTLQYRQWSDLISLRGAATVGDSWGTEFDHYIDKNLQVTPLITLQQGFKMLDAGRLDYVIATHFQGLQTLAQLDFQDAIKPAKTTLTEEALYLAFSKSSPHKQLSQALDAWLTQPDTQNFIQSYLQQYEPELIANP